MTSTIKMNGVKVTGGTMYVDYIHNGVEHTAESVVPTMFYGPMEAASEALRVVTSGGTEEALAKNFALATTLEAFDEQTIVDYMYRSSDWHEHDLGDSFLFIFPKSNSFHLKERNRTTGEETVLLTAIDFDFQILNAMRDVAAKRIQEVA